MKSLAENKNWSYRFLDDALFEYVPDRIHTKLTGQLSMAADIVRLAWAKTVFADNKDLDRIIWFDADIFVFAPTLFDVEDRLDFAVGRQIWIQPGQDNKLKIYRQVHNAVLVITRQSPVPDFLLHSIITMADRMDRISSPQMLGPKMLTALHNIVGFDAIENVGMASPLVLRDLAARDGLALRALLKESTTPLAALNLCSSYRDQTVDGVSCGDALYNQVLDYLSSQPDGLAAS